jgi:hypothetical protein
MGGACDIYGGKGEVYTGFWWGSVRERGHLGRPMYRSEDNTRVNIQEMGWKCGLD